MSRFISSMLFNDADFEDPNEWILVLLILLCFWPLIVFAAGVNALIMINDKRVPSSKGD